METVPGGKYRPRRRNELTATEKESIVTAYRETNLK